MAKQANGSVVVRSGDTMVLVTAVLASKSSKRGAGLLSLTVNYQEKPMPAVRFRRFFQA